jgi:hypothetical protein
MELFEFAFSASLFHKPEIKFLKKSFVWCYGKEKEMQDERGIHYMCTIYSKQFLLKFLFFVLLLFYIDLLHNANCRHVLPSSILLTTDIFNDNKLYEGRRTVSGQ